MKITKIETLCASRLHSRAEQWMTDHYRSIKADIALVAVYTDSELVGYGEACSYGNPLQIANWAQWYEPQLLGADIDDFSAVPRPTGSSFEHGTGSAHDYAVAGIDCALWDLRGKAAGLPVRSLLAGDAAESVGVYASGGVRYDWHADPRTLIDDVISYVALGYSTVKVRLGTAWEWDGVTPSMFLDLFRQLQREVGDDVVFAVDGNSRLTRSDALEVAIGLSDLGAAFFEEPIAKTDLEGYVQLNAAVPIKISGGESFATREQFRPWMEKRAFDIVQPDAGVCGISEAFAIGELASQNGLEFIPHSWHNGLMAMANAHVVAALPNASLLEECMVQGPLKWGSIEGGSPVVDGVIDLSSSIGLGVSPLAEIETVFPYVEGHYSVEVFR